MGSIPLVVKSGNVDMKYFRGTLTSICQVQKKRRMKKKIIVYCVNSLDLLFLLQSSS